MDAHLSLVTRVHSRLGWPQIHGTSSTANAHSTARRRARNLLSAVMGTGQRFVLCLLCWTVILCVTLLPTVLGKKHILNRTIHSFLGIPFAKPPVGELRFRRPVPISRWEEVLAADEMPPRCIQVAVQSQEDCLYLNVWTPTLNKSQNLAVMVYFHGGAFFFERPLFQRDLRYMAALGNVVVVKMNYRLGAFGFLSAGTDDAPGNMGIYDTYIALLFVRDNIRLFGGDPEKITAFGNSAGAITIGLMATSPMAHSLIKGAILQSGSPCISIIARENRSLEISNKLAYMTGCAQPGMSFVTHGQQIVACLRRVSADIIVNAQRALFASLEIFLPTFGDPMLPVHILDALDMGLFNKSLKLLIGVTPDEGTSLLSTASPQFFRRESHQQVSQSDMYSTCNRTFLHSFSKSALRRIYWSYMGLYGHSDFLALRNALSNCIADYFVVCPAHEFAQKLNRKASVQHVASRAGGVEVYFYLFDYRSKNSIYPPWMGVVHTAELNYLFGEPYFTSWYTNEERRFSSTIVDIWATFARKGYESN
ncbi:hypothetical protein HPB48_016286 [Haemaphysalis longicornis]|uniref:acetylcholinesterase n=1 Tax=Haemaphysalis longicornis TaxID=44386 RepID=A0A9J6FTS7_HAELO|nr:hypothetical protein HPB48_016286 [Haemaphysalis longicornis]